MSQIRNVSARMPLLLRLSGLAAVSAALLLLLAPGPAGAQETVVRLEVDAPEQPVPDGGEFTANVLIENVEHLAGYDFRITFDPDKLEVVDVEGEEDFLRTGERQELFCGVPETPEGSVAVQCNTLGPPLCLDGQAGAAGSGVLARVIFRAVGGGKADLEMASSTLALDDFVDCTVDDPQVGSIEHQREGNASVDLVGGGGGLSLWMLILIIAGVLVLALVLGGGGYLWYRRRSAPGPQASE
jgi:hypothetical protein